MLILIAGITGNVGQHAARAGLSKGHQIRGLGRSPERLDPAIRSHLERFVVSSTYYDITALEDAVKGVDAVICAYAGMPELALDGQLLLLRAAERAGVKIYLGASWNYDIRNISLYDEEVYDAYLCFHAQVSISSSIKPLHIFTGMLAEVFFGMHPERGFEPKDDGVWDPEPEDQGERVRAMDIYGTGDEPWFFTTEANAGAFSIAVVEGEKAEEGGFLTLFSCKHSLREVAEIYRRVHPGAKVNLNSKGSVEVLAEKAKAAKKQWGRASWWKYHRLFFQLFTIEGIWNLGDPDYARYPEVKATSMEDFFRQNSEI